MTRTLSRATLLLTLTLAVLCITPTHLSTPDARSPLALAAAPLLPAATVTSVPDSTPHPSSLAALDWPLYGGDSGNTRYAPATAITTSNVGTLRLAWSFHTGVFGRGTSFESTPVVADGRLYLTAPDDEVFALDPMSGRVLWHVTPMLARDTVPTRVNRGVAYGEGRVYVATLDARLIALDAATGRQMWATALVPDHHSYFESMAPTYDHGRVFVGIAGGEQEIRGFVAAFDARTGHQQWRFYTIPAPSEPGGKTWPRGLYKHGGGSVWMTPTVDPALNLLIFCVANPSPDFNGAPRPGTNLYSNSIVALHADTGKLAWYFQEVHHDLWDTDPASPPVLLSVPIGGHSMPAVIQAGKTGWLYVLDRRSGRPLVPAPEQPVPQGPSWQHAWPTQPKPQNQPFAPQCPAPGLYAHEACIFTPPSGVPTLMAPGQIGGSAWSPVAYSPRTGLAYIAANTYPMVRSTAPSACCFSRAPQTLSTVPPQGALVGYDIARGRIAWQAPLDGLAYGGSAVTAGDVVFSGESAGYFDAHDARSGRLLWRFHTGAGADAAPSVYVAGNREYVAIAAGGNSVIGSPRGDALDVFALP